ncbi:hypothetical protein SNK03_011823 [Fusarium graminearum]
MSSSRQSDERLVSSVLSTAAPTKTAVETATATMTKTMTVTATPGGGDSGLSISSIVGIALGSAAAAVALTLCVIAWFYLKRRRLHPADPDTSSDTPPPEIFVPETSQKELGPGNGFTGLPTYTLLMGNFCPDVKFNLRGISSCFIKTHVRQFYHLDNVSVTPSTLCASLQNLHLTDTTCHMIAKLLIDPKTRYLAIRHLLARVLFSNVDPHTVGPLSLLPPTVKELFQWRTTMQVKEDHPRLEAALRSWHRITAFLLHEDPEKRTGLKPPPSVKSQIEELVAVLQESLVHFVTRKEKQQRTLTNICAECVDLGYELFSDPSDWEFIIPEDEQALCVTPGLKLITDSRGVPRDPPFVALDPEIIAIKDAKN